jgi:translation initiation factor IF-1
MDLYSFSLTLGGAGLLVMAFLGMSHGHAAHGHASHGHTAHHGHHGHDAHHGHQAQHGERAIMSLLSPRVIFSFLLGLGTAGVAFRSMLGGPLLFALAVAGGVVLERLVVNPLWNFSFRFASRPALTLESAIEDEAKAVTNFDKNGQGLISVEVDGHMVQCLGTLISTDRESGVRVRAGDTVRIEDVDADRNRCTVRRA